MQVGQQQVFCVITLALQKVEQIQFPLVPLQAVS